MKGNVGGDSLCTLPCDCGTKINPKFFFEKCFMLATFEVFLGMLISQELSTLSSVTEEK